MPTRDAMYRAMARSTSKLPPHVQKRILDWALAEKENDVLCDLAGRDDLADSVEAELFKVRNADVAAAWMSIPKRARRFADALVSGRITEKRMGVLAELAKRPNLPPAVYQRCADRDHFKVAAALLANRSVPSPVRETAAVSVMTAPISIQTSSKYPLQVQLMLLRNPELFDVATAHTTSARALAAALLTPGMEVTSRAAERFIDAVSLELSTISALMSSKGLTSTVRLRTHLLAADLGSVAHREVLPIAEAHRLSEVAAAGAEKLRKEHTKLTYQSNLPASLGRHTQKLRLQQQTRAGEFARLLQTTDPDEWTREVTARRRIGAFYQNRATAAVWSRGITADRLVGLPRSTVNMRNVDSLLQACIYHLEEGRRDAAIAMAVLRTSPHESKILDVLRERGVSYEELVAAGVDLNLRAGEPFYMIRWAQEASELRSDLLGDLPTTVLATTVGSPQIRDMVIERLVDAFGDDDTLWDAFEMIASREFHGSFNELIATVRDLAKLDQ